MTESATDPAAQSAEGQSQPDPAAPWGDDENFDPDRAKKLIASLKGENTKLKNRPALTDEQQKQLDAYDKLVKANQTELEKVQGEVTRWQSDAETWRKAAVGSKIQALAADTFADPSDAVAALAEKNFLDAGGQIDESAIRSELQAVLQAKPHWAKPADTTARVPAPNPHQGTSGAAVASDPAAQFGALIQGALGA